MKVIFVPILLFITGCQSTSYSPYTYAAGAASGLGASASTAASVGSIYSTVNGAQAIPVFQFLNIFIFLSSLMDCSIVNGWQMETPLCVKMCAEKKMLHCPAHIRARYDQCDPDSKTEQEWSSRPAWWCGAYYPTWKPDNYTVNWKPANYDD